MLFLHFAAVVIGFTSAAANAFPLGASPQLTELASLLSAYKNQKITGCDLSGAVMPETNGTKNLSPPDAGTSLARVVLGRGVQNYTCADSLSTTIPAANGAVATLYDASCLAACNPTLLHTLPDIMVNLPKDTIAESLSIVTRMTRQPIMVGHHYFAPNNTIPVFDFRVQRSDKYLLAGQRDEGVPAVTTASKGEMGVGYGAVDWLRIKAIPDMSVDYKLAYRILTAGGKPPATCQGMAKEFSVEYATEYWIYA
ncbi:uncharacterized protein LAJ45_07946 [Morchella importuna]|uniref:Malate dehydrogenase n=1 Tax=Morchella conica CCBAS932 TaxID=1392247 RepID=A0A3N4KRW8_9PEZI|nr:uncharacterized protein LAJ45_07946 [Morchella importuna]KAH8147846.1 hypothetical protein LAJ45_07946 [Morchella importuna]RPB13293.1 hypothetical protein P167DRAFT_544648 [Morchella conica CCBAS932]